MNLVELDRALRKLRLSGMADTLETRLRQAQSENLAPIDFLSALVADELLRRQDRLFTRHTKLARFRDPDRSLDSFDFDFNKKMNRALVYELATARFIANREDALFLGPPGTGKSHLAQAIGRAAILQGYRVFYREAHTLIEEIAEANVAGNRKELLSELAAVPLLIIDDLGMRKLPHTAAEDLLELVMRRYERASTILTSNRLCGATHKRFNAESPVMRSGRPSAVHSPSPGESVGLLGQGRTPHYRDVLPKGGRHAVSLVRIGHPDGRPTSQSRRNLAREFR
jgi:DNA replication protein DnaC